MIFNKNNTQSVDIVSRNADFAYLSDKNIYMDSSCQTLRPQAVIDTLTEYYQKFNACGGRVKYMWGQKVDGLVEETRELLLDYLKLSKRDYFVSFTLNTTYGINLITSQIKAGLFDQVITSDIEHNSVFLPTIEIAKRLNIPRKVLSRDKTGNLIYDDNDLKKAIVIVNVVSNIDGRKLANVKQLVDDVHKSGGIVILDAAQGVAHYPEILQKIPADAVCFSAHKMYSASLGVMVVRKDLLTKLDNTFVGGGMVSGVSESTYELTPDDYSSRFEPGLQSYGEIIALNSAIKWLKNQNISQHINTLSQKLYEGLKSIPGLHIVNDSPSSVISVYHDSVDAHRMAIFLSAAGIMVRSGYFCCHYYLIEKSKMPPLVRFSIGLHSTEADIDATIKSMKKITRS